RVTDQGGTMKPYRVSTSARILSGGAAFALIAGGLVAVLGLDPARAIPLVILVTIAAGLGGLIFAITEHLGAALSAAILMPPAMWMYVLGLVGVIRNYPSLGWALIAGGGVPLALFVVSLGSRPEPEKVGETVRSS